MDLADSCGGVGDQDERGQFGQPWKIFAKVIDCGQIRFVEKEGLGLYILCGRTGIQSCSCIWMRKQ